MADGTLGLSPAMSAYLAEIQPSEPDVLLALREAIAKHQKSSWHVAVEQARFMGELATLLATRRYLEVGTFAGYGTLAMALACPKMEIVTCEIAEEFVAIGEPFWAKAGVVDRIDLRMGPAGETMAALIADGASFDMVFVDADKAGYPSYVRAAKQLVPSGGVILVDNVFWGGAVIDAADTRRSTRAIRDVNIMLRDDPELSISVIPIGDGLTMARRL